MNKDVRYYTLFPFVQVLMWALHDSQQLCYCYLYEKPKNRLLKEILKKKKEKSKCYIFIGYEL